ncbi:hypothetical protein M426DRAFT_27043 [Hypoxylon sp. CI-4A]|nr:hypothetical protein M426DRAFT_27043 [Hypoxylon sp. CI-4A]
MALLGSTNIIIISVVFSLLALLAVGLRFRARTLQRAGFGIDDYMILPGLLFSLALSVDNIVAAIMGNLGNHIPLGTDGVPIFDKRMTIFLQTEFASQLLSVLSLVFTKISIVSFYRRIFRGDKFTIITQALTGAICVWGVSFFFATLFECYPVGKVWLSLFGQPEHERYCYNHLPMFYATAISNMIMDILILAIPLPMVWKLKMPRRQKIAVSGIFLLGALIYFFYQAGPKFSHAYDVTFNYAPTLYWTQLEAAVAVICACLPTMRILLNGISLDRTLDAFRSKVSLLISKKTSATSVSSLDHQHGENGVISTSRFGGTGEAIRLPSHEEPLELQYVDGITIHKTFEVVSHRDVV